MTIRRKLPTDCTIYALALSIRLGRSRQVSIYRVRLIATARAPSDDTAKLRSRLLHEINLHFVWYEYRKTISKLYTSSQSLNNLLKYLLLNWSNFILCEFNIIEEFNTCISYNALWNACNYGEDYSYRTILEHTVLPANATLYTRSLRLRRRFVENKSSLLR